MFFKNKNFCDKIFLLIKFSEMKINSGNNIIKKKFGKKFYIVIFTNKIIISINFYFFSYS